MPEQAGMSIFALATMAAEHLQASLPDELSKPLVGIICGSGLGGLVDTIQPEPKFEVEYTNIPFFPKPTGMFLDPTKYHVILSKFAL